MTVEELIEKVCNSKQNKPNRWMTNPFRICSDINCPAYKSRLDFGRDKRGSTVSKIAFDKITNHVKIYANNREYVYCDKKWYSDGMYNRNTLENEINAWPGYITAIEDMLHGIEIEQSEKEFQLCERENLCRKKELDIAKLRTGSFMSWLDSNPSENKPYPKQLKKIKNIKRLNMIKENPWHVYFLVYNDTVVYVGQTRAVWPSRIEQHLRDSGKVFDDVFYIPVDSDKINDVEYYYIKKFNPIYNKQKMSKEG